MPSSDLLSILRIQCAKYDGVDIVVPPEEEPEQTLQVCHDKKASVLTVDINAQCCTHFLWLSVRVIPCEETLKWTTVEVGGGLELRVMVVAFCTAWTPVSDSISTEHRYHTLQAAGGHPHQK